MVDFGVALLGCCREAFAAGRMAGRRGKWASLRVRTTAPPRRIHAPAVLRLQLCEYIMANSGPATGNRLG